MYVCMYIYMSVYICMYMCVRNNEWLIFTLSRQPENKNLNSFCPGCVGLAEMQVFLCLTLDLFQSWMEGWSVLLNPLCRPDWSLQFGLVLFVDEPNHTVLDKKGTD